MSDSDPKSMSDSNVLLEAKFDERVCTYWVLTGVIILLSTVFGIPLILLWLPLGGTLTRRYLERMSCVLTDKKLHFKKGYFVRVEKTVPLDRITDLGVVQGPIMRHFGIWRLAIETAGQSGPGALLSMTGIIDARGYREKVLAARDALVGQKKSDVEGTPLQSPPAVTASSDAETKELLTDVRDTLGRIETLLKERN